MHWADFVVLSSSLLVLVAIGLRSGLRAKSQEDYFLGGRSFGKLLQTFAAFSAGTGSSDPVDTGGTAFAGGMSGIWSATPWLFAAPFYWVAGVWYRRMRHLTLGDWFVERYESRALGAAYGVFGLLFLTLCSSVMFSAVGVVAVPLVGSSCFLFHGREYGIEYILVPIVGLAAWLCGVAGGLRAVYYTGLVQGVCIVISSLLMIPLGLRALVRRFGHPESDGWMAGFRILREQLPDEFFSIAGSPTAHEFPLQRILVVAIIGLVGIAVQPHLIATGGGSAKTELDARFGLVAGNLLRLVCTLGWAVTALIALALFADSAELVQDPRRTWGVASGELWGPGLAGLMLAGLLAALVSAVGTYMVLGGALIVRNIYAPYINPRASEGTCVLLGRLTGSLVIVGAAMVSLSKMDVVEQLTLTWVSPLLFAAPFWVGMYWRRATATGAWCSVAFCALMFFVIPGCAPLIFPPLRDHPRFLATTRIVETRSFRPASPADVRRRQCEISLWDDATAAVHALPDPSERSRVLARRGARPQPITVGDTIEIRSVAGGEAVFWAGGVQPVDSQGNARGDVKWKPVGSPFEQGGAMLVTLGYGSDVRLRGCGSFRLDFLIYQLLGLDLRSVTSATLGTLELLPKVVLPFLVMIGCSFISRRNSQFALDRYYAKMKTPVIPDSEQDKASLVSAYSDPRALEGKKLFPGTDWEFQKPTALDVMGFVLCAVAGLAIVGAGALLARPGRN